MDIRVVLDATGEQTALLPSQRVPKADLHRHAETYANLDRLIARRDNRPPYDWQGSIKRMAELPPGVPRIERFNGDLDTAELDPFALDYVHFVEWVTANLEEAAEEGTVLVELRFGVGAGMGPDHMSKFREAERNVRDRYPCFYAEALGVMRVPTAGRPDGFESVLRAHDQGLAGIDFFSDPYDSEADWTEIYALARIHRRTALGTALEEASGCSSESGIMVLEQKPARKLRSTQQMLPQNKPDRIRIVFDDHRLVANAGLLLPATLARHLGLRELVDHHLDLGGAPGRANTGDKMLTLVASALAGGDCIDDADALRAGGTVGVLGCVVKAPSTLGTFLRSFRWGHVRQLDRVSRQLLARAWAAGAGPGDSPLTIDLDSTICETYGLAKEGARHHGYTGARGYHPLLAIAAGTGEVLMSRLREGRANTARGAAHFLRETVGRVRYGGARGQLTVRADSGFYTHTVVAACREMDVRFSITIRQRASLRDLIEAIPEEDWTPIPYWMDGAADVAETTYTPFQTKPDAAPVRLIVRRVKPTPGSQLALFARYSYHAFITDRDGETLELEADHRRHAEVENAIRDLKYGVGLNHMPSARFAANGAWLAVQVMAHNLARWTARIGLGERTVITKTLRRRVFALVGRITRSARRLTLHLPRRWPWETQFSRALARLQAIPFPA